MMALQQCYQSKNYKCNKLEANYIDYIASTGMYFI